MMQKAETRIAQDMTTGGVRHSPFTTMHATLDHGVQWSRIGRREGDGTITMLIMSRRQTLYSPGNAYYSIS
jgi:hypothetical protein